MGHWTDRLLRACGRGLLWILITIITLVVGSVVTFVPLSWLPGEIPTDYVNGHMIDIVGMLILLGVLIWRFAPLAGTEDAKPPSIAIAAKFMWVFTSSMILGVWPIVFLAWLNAYGVKAERSHDMRVVGEKSTRIRPAGTPIEHLRLSEIGTGWTADLQPDDGRLLRTGSCARIMVRQGRLGLDWISDAEPIACPRIT